MSKSLDELMEEAQKEEVELPKIIHFDWFLKYTDDPLIKRFAKFFNVEWTGMLPGTGVYIDTNSGTYHITVGIREFWQMVGESLRQKKNLFLIPENKVTMDAEICY